MTSITSTGFGNAWFFGQICWKLVKVLIDVVLIRLLLKIFFKLLGQFFDVSDSLELLIKLLRHDDNRRLTMIRALTLT